MPQPLAQSDERQKAKSLWRANAHAVCLALILILGFVLRAAGVAWGEAYNHGSLGDSFEAYEVAVAYSNGDDRAQYLGQPNFKAGAKLPGPAWTLLCVAALKAWGSIEGLSWVLVLLNVGAIYLTYLLAAVTVGRSAGLAAALFVATSPRLINHAIIVYNPAVMPILSTLMLLSLWRVVRTNRSRAIGWVIFLLLLMQQFHVSALSLIPAVAVVIWLAGQPLNFWWVGIGCAGGFALYLPYFFGEMSHAWTNTFAMFTAAGSGRAWQPLRALTAPLSFLVNYWKPRSFYTPAEYEKMCRSCLGGVEWFKASNILATIVAFLLMARVFLLGRTALWGFWSSPREAFQRSPGTIFLCVLCAIPLLFELFTVPTIYPRYTLIIMAPLFSLCGAAAVAWLADRRFRSAFAAMAGAMVLLNAWFMLATYRFQGQHIQQAPRFLASFRHLEEVHQSLRAFTGEGNVIEVDDRNYLAPSGVENDKWFWDTKFIRRYVTVREREHAPRSAQSEKATVVFELSAINGTETAPADAAYFGNGICLIPSRAGNKVRPPTRAESD